MLDVGRNQNFAGRRLDEREDGFAEGAGLGKFDEAPFALEPIFRENQNDRFGAG